MPERDASGGRPVPLPRALEDVAVATAVRAAAHIRSAGARRAIATKSSDTDVVTQTDIDTEALIRSLLLEATPGCGIIGEEGGALAAGSRDDRARVEWVIDPLDGTVNFVYGLPVFAVSIAAAVDGEFVAGAVVDVLRSECFSATLDGGARLDGAPVSVSSCAALPSALIATGFSYDSGLRARQGDIVQRLLPAARDIRCFGSAALQLCWVGCGRLDGYFERDIKLWDWAAGALIASEAGATVELPCPENVGLMLAATPRIFDALRDITALV